MRADLIVFPELLTPLFANMRLSTRHQIFHVALILTCGYANAGSIVKRDNDGSGRLSAYVNTSIDYVRGIPLFGGYVADFLDWLVRAISLFEAGTNGALARLLGGVLPCRITLDGTDCAGLSNNGGFEKLFMDVLDGIPSLILPDIGPISRLADAIFGGVSIN